MRKNYTKFCTYYIALIYFSGMFHLLNCQGLQNKKADSTKSRTIQHTDFNRNTVSNEYIVTLGENSGIEEIKKIFKEYGIKEISPIGKNMFLLKLINDPGLKQLEKVISTKKAIKAIQPNFRYRAF